MQYNLKRLKRSYFHCYLEIDYHFLKKYTYAPKDPPSSDVHKCSIPLPPLDTLKKETAPTYAKVSAHVR